MADNTQSFTAGLGLASKFSDVIRSLTLSLVARSVFGNKRITIFDITIGDGLKIWPVAGVSLAPRDLYLDRVEFVKIAGKSMDYYYDYTNELLKAYLPAATGGASNVRVPAENSTPNETVRCLVIGWGG